MLGGFFNSGFRTFVLMFLDLQAPLVWDASLDSATREYNHAFASYQKRSLEWEKKHGRAYRAILEARIESTQSQAAGPSIPTSQQGMILYQFNCVNQGFPWRYSALVGLKGGKKRAKKVPEPPKAPEKRMQADEDILFLKLGTAMKIYTQYEISATEIARASGLLTEYLLEYKQVSSSIHRRLSTYWTSLGSFIRLVAWEWWNPIIILLFTCRSNSMTTGPCTAFGVS
jgi:hypothetical protein